MRRSRLLVAACIVLLAAGLPAQDEEEAPRPHRARPAAPSARASTSISEDRAFLRQLGEAQRALSEQLQQLRERVESLHGELTSREDEDAGAEDEVKALREEVKGLYVEISGVKQQIDSVREDVQGVNSNVQAFRTFSGFFIAAMLLLLSVIFLLTIRR